MQNTQKAQETQQEINILRLVQVFHTDKIVI